MKNVSQKVIKDLVQGLNPVTGSPIAKQQRSLQRDIMNALLRSHATNDDGQLSRLVDDLYFFTSDDVDSQESKVMNQIMRCAICDDFITGINAHELSDDYQVPLTKVFAYLIDEGLLTADQSVFFTRALQHSEPRSDVQQGANVVKFDHYKSTINKPLHTARV